ncbi:MAG TPA: hydrogenase maturation protease [Bryobacteraceae bacterium]|nr:hydrogenase maturation protease [Bryobacteraceae bacterium]
MLILCCGNLERGDDAAGLLVGRRLRTLGVEVREHSGEALSLMEAWRGAEDVMLVDAVVTGARAGTVSVWDARSAAFGGGRFRGSSHALGVAEAVELAQALGCLPARLLVCGIEGREFAAGASPSAAVLAGVEEAARRIYENWSGGTAWISE